MTSVPPVPVPSPPVSDAVDPAALAFRGVIARFGIPGWSPDRLAEWAERYCPGAVPSGTAACPPGFAGEFAKLEELLLEHRRDDSRECAWLAPAIAGACAGGNHLWEDMGLPNRDTLSRLIRRHFPILYHKNAAGMRWKKFFYRQLCDRAEARLCAAPSCGECCDYSACFGPE